MKTQAFGYIRVSSKSQLQKFGDDKDEIIKKDGPIRQEDAIRKFSKGRFDIDKIFTDIVTGTSDEDNRPEFQSMMSEILRNGVRTIIVEGLDRLARTYRIQETLLIYLVSKDVTLFSARTGENVTEAIAGDPMKLALVQMQGIFSQLEKSQLVIRMRKARERIRKRVGKCEGRKGYTESPQYAEVLNHIRQFSIIRRTSGWIADFLNDNNYRTLSGKAFTSQIVRNIRLK